MQRFKQAQVLVITLLALTAISIIIVGVSNLSNRDVQEVVSTREYEEAYNAAENSILQLVQKYGNSTVSLSELESEFSQCTASLDVYTCNFTEQGKEVDMRVQDSSEVEDYELSKDQSLEIRLGDTNSFYLGRVNFSRTNEVPLEFSFIYKDASGDIKNVNDMFDTAGKLDAYGGDPLSRTDPIEYTKITGTDTYWFNVNDVQGFDDATDVPLTLRITNRSPESQLSLLDISGSADFPTQVRKFTATGYEAQGSNTVAEVVAQVPLLGQSVPAFHYSILGEQALNKKALCGNNVVDTQAGEECDNGLINNGQDGLCTAQCKFEAGQGNPYAYRKPITVSETSGQSASNYQVTLDVDTQSLINSGKMQADCADMRFTQDSDFTADTWGTTYDYWVEPGTCNTSNTKVWVETDLNANSDTDFYMYYGNNEVAAADSVNATFIEEIDGVVGAWDFNGDAKDSSGNGNDGTVNGASLTTGKFGQAYSFDGVDDDVETPDSGINGSITVSTWFKLAQLPATNSWMALVVSDEGGSQNMGHQIHMGNNPGRKIQGTIRDNQGNTSEVYSRNLTLSDVGTWHHVVLSFDDSTNETALYLDGIKQDSDYSASTQVNSPRPNIIGSYHNGNQNFNGAIDEVRIYDQVLSEQQIQDIYGDGSSRGTYTTANYPGKLLVRKYGLTYSTSFGAEEPSP